MSHPHPELNSMSRAEFERRFATLRARNAPSIRANPMTIKPAPLADYATCDLDSLAFECSQQPTRREWMARSAGVILIACILILGLAAAFGAIG